MHATASVLAAQISRGCVAASARRLVFIHPDHDTPAGDAGRRPTTLGPDDEADASLAATEVVTLAASASRP
jgi:hypothetical protein